MALGKPWQLDVIDMLKRDESRTVHFIMHLNDDEEQWLLDRAAREEPPAHEIPCTLRSRKSIMKNAYDAPNKSAFVMHAPWEEDRKTWEFYACVENIKDGFLWSFTKREFKDEHIDPPSVIVLARRFPKLKYMQSDCWVFHRIVGDRLVDVRHPKLDRVPAA